MDDDAKTYRGRGMHARLAAQETKVPEYRAVFESLAKSYDLKADEAERISSIAQQAVSSVSDGG